MVHEWALADSIVLYVKNQGLTKIRRLIVKLGALQSIDKEILEFALRELSRQSEVVVDVIEIVEEQPELRCNTCGYSWVINLDSMSEHVRESIHFLPESIYAFIRCPRCGGIDYEIVKGRGLGEILVEQYD
ncbi:MAG: hydrogenase nickel incorporation protein HypA [Desulfurococcaceae archaeon]